MTDAVAEEVVAEALSKVNYPYVLGTEGPSRFDCSGLVYWIFNHTGHGALMGGVRRRASGYARWFADRGKYSRNFSDARRGDLICYAHAGPRPIGHIAVYLGGGQAVSALNPSYGVRKHSVFGINVPFDGVCLVDYPSDPGRVGPDDTPSQEADPEISAYPASRLSTVQILYNGDDITDNVKFDDAEFTTQAGPNAGQAYLRVRDKEHAYSRSYFHAGGTLELLIDGSREWDGWVMAVDRVWSFDVEDSSSLPRLTHWWRLSGYDRNLLFARRFNLDKANPVNLDFGTYAAGAIDQDVVRDILENYTTLDEDGLDLVTGITPVGPIDPYRSVKAVSAGQSLGQTMLGVAAMNGALFYIDPDRVYRYVDDITDRAVYALSDQPADGEVGYRDLVIEEDGAQLYNDALVWGAGVGSPNPVFARVQSEDSINLHGRLQFGGIERAMYKEESVQRRADTLVNGSPAHNRGHKDDVVRIRCTVFAPGLRVGDGVAFRSVAWDFGDLNYDPADLTYVPGSYDKNTEFERLLFQIGKIESNNTYTRQNRRSFAYGRWQVMPGNWRVWGPLALGLPRSVGVASRDIDPSLWYPPPTQGNQDRVVRWRMGQMYNNKGQDPRRVAAAWRSGTATGSHEPSTWSRGTLLYVNHACMPLGYPETTATTVLTPISEPTVDRGDFQPSVNSDDVYPIRKITIDFPTPTSARYKLVMSHEYDTPWAVIDPLPPYNPGPTPPGGYTEIINLYAPDWAEPQPGSGITYGDEYLAMMNYTVGENRLGTFMGEIFPWTPAKPGIYSTVGRLNGGIDALSWPDTNCGLGSGAWTGWENREAWYRVGPTGYTSGPFPPPDVAMELEIGHQLVGGLVSGLQVRVAYAAPVAGSYKNGTEIGVISNPNGNAISIRDDWATAYGAPLMDVDWGSIVIPAGVLTDDCWIILSPAWQCYKMPYPSYWCDSSYAGIWGLDDVGAKCANRGPACTGMGKSGVFSGSGPSSLTLKAIPQATGDWANYPTPGTDNEPPSYWADGLYRTTYPYIAGTLEITWQGITLTRGVDYTETDPANGLFTINQIQSGETQITITYKIPPNAAPTNPLPGEPGGPGDGTSNDAAVEAVIAQAWSMVGVPYQLGAESRSQTDCSGLIYRIFTDAGYGSLVGTSRKVVSGYVRYFSAQGRFTRDMSAARRGDLIIYSDNGVRTSHMGIYLGDGRVISALINPYGVTAHRILGISTPTYGVCLVPYPASTSRSSPDTSDVDPTDPEVGQTPTETLPPQTPTTSTGRVYRPRPQSQFGWGTQWDGQNCNMAAAAMALDRHTLGIYSDVSGTPLDTPPNMRLYSGKTGPESLTRVGTTLNDAAVAWDAGWSEILALPGPISWAYFVAQIQDGRGAIVHGRETALAEPYRRSDWQDAHAVYVNEVLSDGSFWVCDPLGRQAMLFPEAVLRAYAQSLYNADVITCAFTRRTPQS